MALFGTLSGFNIAPTIARSTSTALGPLCDIGLNLCDEMFQGIYNDKQKHADDTEMVLERAKSMNVLKMVITSGNVDQSRQSLAMVDRYGKEYGLHATVGVHPTRCGEFLGKEEEVVASLEALIVEGLEKNTCVAIGEAGLD